MLIIIVKNLNFIQFDKKKINTTTLNIEIVHKSTTT